ncbi:MAG TPA: PAS domain S-box protein, partial [Syntrophobacteraceae bacterium]|nr:PAS domain S-box protein [Syntrophobacteraceae bacterium]
MQEKTIRILLIDDDEEDFTLIRNMLAGANVCRYDPDWAKTCADGLQKIKQTEYDAILLNYAPGERKGIEFLDRAGGDNRKAPVILLTARGEFGADVQAMEAGVSICLEKKRLSTRLLDRSIRHAIQNKLNEVELRKRRDNLQELVWGLTRQLEEESEQLGVANRMLQAEAAQRAKAEEALRESESIYRKLIDTTGTGYVVADKEGIVLDANYEYVRLSGHSSLEEIMGRSIFEWTAPYDLERNAEEIGKCIACGTMRDVEIDYVDREGHATRVEINGTLVQTAQGQARICLVKDISERGKKEAELRRKWDDAYGLLEATVAERTADLAETNRYLENIFENTPDIIAIVDEHGKFIKWNRKAVENLGYSLEELSDKSVFELYPDKNDLDRMLTDLRREGTVKKYQANLKKKDGTVAAFEISISLLRDNANKVIGSVGVARDLSDI